MKVETKPRYFNVGDVQVHGSVPAKLLKALAVMAQHLHDFCDAPGTTFVSGKSKESCILSSAIVRDFLYRVGFRDADVRACALFMVGRRPGEAEPVHSLGIGDPRLGPGDNVIWRDFEQRWNGHAVVVTQGFLIDPTLYQAQRPQHWPGLPGMVCTPLNTTDDEPYMGLPILAGSEGVAENGVDTAIVWLDQPLNTGWQTSPDYKRKHERRRISEMLVGAFGKWEDGE